MIVTKGNDSNKESNNTNQIKTNEDVNSVTNNEEKDNSKKETGKNTKSKNDEVMEKYQSDETKPYLPDGFSISKESLQSKDPMAEGLIVTDNEGNEYVWVEVPRTIYSKKLQEIGKDEKLTDSQYDAIEKAMQEYAKDYRSECKENKSEGGWAADIYNYKNQQVGNIKNENDYIKLKKKMLKSVFDNGGFYVARYEAGTGFSTPLLDGKSEIPDSLTPYSRANLPVINNITCSQAQTLASKVAPSGYNSSLLFGIQADLVLKFMESKTPSNKLKTSEGKNIFKEDCSSWGNYCFGVEFSTNSEAKYFNKDKQKYEELNPNLKPKDEERLLTTGATHGATGADNDRNSIANIHDFVGNVAEWTLENYNSDYVPCCIRGGAYSSSGKVVTATFRLSNSSDYVEEYEGFRVAIY